MKSTVKAAVGLALLGATSAAFATSVTIPTAGPTPDPGLGAGGIVVEIWDTNNGNPAISAWLGFDTTSFGGPAEAAAGRTLDFGVVSSQFATLFGADIAAGTVKFAITGANLPSGGSPLLDIGLSSLPTKITNGGLATVAGAIVTGVEAGLNGTSGCNSINPCVATTGATDPHYTVNNLGGLLGTLGALTQGTAGSGTLAFYQITKNGTSVLGTATTTAFANATGAGVWALSATGDLTYTVPGVAAVPLPAAIWLLGSGLLGLAGVSRRKTLVS